MPSIIGKKQAGKTYYYLVESARVNGKPRIVSQKYLGSAEEVMARLGGGSPGDPSTTEGAVRLVGGTNSDTLRILTESGQVQQLRASGWQNIGVVASILATQQ